MKAQLIGALVALSLAGCGSGGSAITEPAPTPAPLSNLPPLTAIRSDLVDPAEGTWAHPLQVDSCWRDWLHPLISWQQAPAKVCNLPSTLYQQTNHIAGQAHGIWRLAVNNEPSWNGDGGPPNQSAPLNGKPFSMASTANTITLGINLAGPADNGGKIPYLGFNYLRGVQGDPVRYLTRWGAIPKLTFTGNLATTGSGSQWVQIWFFFRDVAGVQYMVRHDLLSPDFDKVSGEVNWNWPAVNSYYYPGAKLSRLVTDGGGVFSAPGGAPFTGSGTQLFTFDIQALALKVQPTFAQLKPDFLGFELAIEQGYNGTESGPKSMQLIVSDLALR